MEGLRLGTDVDLPTPVHRENLQTNEALVKVAEAWERQGREAVDRFSGLVMQKGTGEILGNAVISGAIPEEAQTIVNATRWLMVHDPDRFKIWMEEIGFGDRERLIIERAAEAFGDKRGLIDGLVGLKEVVEREIGQFPDGELLGKVIGGVLLIEQPQRSITGEERSWFKGKGGEGSSASLPPGSGGEKKREDKDEEDSEPQPSPKRGPSWRERLRLTGRWTGRQWDETVRKTTAVRRWGLASGCAVALLGCCALTGLLGVGSKDLVQGIIDEFGDKKREVEAGLGGEAAQRDLFKKELIENYGVRRVVVNDAEIDLGKIIYGGDEDHDQIDYVVGLFDKEGYVAREMQIAYGETTMFMLSKEGFLSSVGEGYVMDANQEVNLRARLAQNGYDSGDVEDFISWVEWYVRNKGSVLPVTIGEDSDRELAVLRGESPRKAGERRERDKLNSVRAVGQSMIRRRLPRF